MQIFRITEKTSNDGITYPVEMIVPLKLLGVMKLSWTQCCPCCKNLANDYITVSRFSGKSHGTPVKSLLPEIADHNLFREPIASRTQLIKTYIHVIVSRLQTFGGVTWHSRKLVAFRTQFMLI